MATKESSLEHLKTYVDTVLLAHESLPSTFEVVGQCISIESDMSGLRLIADRLLNDYASEGCAEVPDLDLADVIFHCDVPFVNSYYMSQRMNINWVLQASMLEVLTESIQINNQKCAAAIKRMMALEGELTLSGALKFREVIAEVISELKTYDINLIDNINEILTSDSKH